MIPLIDTDAGQDLITTFALTEQPSTTYRMDLDRQIIRGSTDHQRAVLQAIYKILMTERYQYPIYSWDYGVELLDLFGEPISFVLPELKRRISEALLQDARILRVDQFRFAVRKRVVHVSFTAHTVYGDLEIEREVTI